jgi:protein-tyrosine phosphatase
MTGTTPALADFDGIVNWRDVGGLATADGRVVAPGLLHRSGHLGKATAQDLAMLTAMGVGLIVDLRTTLEAEDEGIGVPSGATRIAFELPASQDYLQYREFLLKGDLAGLAELFGAGSADAIATAGIGRMGEFYVAMTDDSDGIFATVLHRLADPDCAPALVHCSAGKDRTGWVVALVLLAVGIPEEDVMADYLLSNKVVHRHLDADEAVLEVLRPAMGVHATYLTAALDHVRATYGSIDAYLGGPLGLTDTQRAALEARLLVPASAT